MCNLSWNPSITPEFVEAHADWEWNMCNLSYNPMNRVPAQKIIARAWRSYKKRKIAKEIYALQLCCKAKGFCLPELVAREIYAYL